VKADGAPPLAAPRFFVPRRLAGWSFLELVIVLGVLAILTFFAVRNFYSQEAIALQQAERLRNDLRHVQMLAITWGQPLRLTATAGNYFISCVTLGAGPCNAVPAPVVNPATGQPYSVNLEPGITLAGPGFNLDLDALGRPKNGASLLAANTTYTISGGTTARSVVVAPVTGFVTAQ
jgi:type II secretory pathway pseudopilin PulG